jgi:hypothetical protein
MHRRAFAGALLALTASLVLPGGQPRAGEIDDLLAAIKKVGREGAGNPEAAKAWKALVAKGPDALLPILAAMNDDERTAGNWLRPAAEAIAEKAHADGKLSAEALEKFLAEKQHAGSARRIAYEWLVKLDKGAPERLLPGMLQDPSAELRYDAVARVIKQAEAELEKKDEKAARASFQKALSGACAPEQVEVIAKALGKLGEKVDLQKHFGIVARWYLVAPFDHHKGKGWDVAYPPEKAVDVAATYDGKDGAPAKWVEHTTKDPNGVVDLNKAVGKKMGAVAYAVAFVESPAERLVELRAGSPNGLKIFLNGKKVFAREEYHHGAFLDQYAPRGTLKKGRNVILVKVCQNEQEENWAQEWRFQLRLCDVVGAAVPFTSVKAPAKEGK